jgi:hypothetical protein
LLKYFTAPKHVPTRVPSKYGSDYRYFEIIDYCRSLSYNHTTQKLRETRQLKCTILKNIILITYIYLFLLTDNKRLTNTHYFYEVLL